MPARSAQSAMRRKRPERPRVAKGHDEVSDKFDGVGLRHRRGRGFFGSGAACQFTPSIVFRTALAAAGAALSSPSQVERMLFGQAAALQSLFVRLTEGALGAETVPNYDLKIQVRAACAVAVSGHA